MNAVIGNTLSSNTGATLWAPTTRQATLGVAALGTHTEVLAPKTSDVSETPGTQALYGQGVGASGATTTQASSSSRATQTATKASPSGDMSGKEGAEQLAAFAGGVTLAFGLDRVVNRWMQQGEAHSPMLRTARFLDQLPGVKQLNHFFDNHLQPLLQKTPFLQALGGYLPPHAQVTTRPVGQGTAGTLTYYELVLKREVEAYQKALNQQLNRLLQKQKLASPDDIQFAQRANAAWADTLQQSIQKHHTLVAKGDVLPSLTQFSETLEGIKQTPLKTLAHEKVLAKHLQGLLQQQSFQTAENITETSKALAQGAKGFLGGTDAAKSLVSTLDIPPIKGSNTQALLQAFEKKLSSESMTLWQTLQKQYPQANAQERLKYFTKQLSTREGLLEPLAKRTSSLFMRLKGMDSFVLQPYEMAYQLKHNLLEQHNRLAQILETSKMSTASQERILRILGQKVVTGQSKEALTKLVQSVPELAGNDAMRQQVLSLLEKQAASKPLGALGRTLVAATTMFSRIIKGETAVASGNTARNLLANGKFSLKKTLAPGTPMGLGLTGLALLGLPFSEAIKAEGDMTEKMKVFVRYFAGFSLGSFVGWELGKRLIHGSQILLRTMPNLMTRKLPGMTMATLVGEVLASIVIGGKVQQLVEGLCDSIIGKPKSIVKKELEEKADKLKAQAERTKLMAQAATPVSVTPSGNKRVEMPTVLPELVTLSKTSPHMNATQGVVSQSANPQVPQPIIASKLPSASLYGQGESMTEPLPQKTPESKGSILPESLPTPHSATAQAGITPNSPLDKVLAPPMPETQAQLEGMAPFLNTVPTEAQGLHPTPEQKPLSVISPEDILKGHVPEPGIEAVRKGPETLVDELRPE
jgi:hypothetical protein